MTDVTIFGAGIFGLSCGYEAARRGARVRVVDPGGPGAGASGGLVGALSPHAPDAWTEAKALQLQALLGAADWWQGVAAASGLPSGYGRIGRVQPLKDDRAVAGAQARVAGADALWQGQAVWRVRPAVAGDPVSASGLVAEDTLSARLHPRLALAALVAAIRGLGGEVVAEAAPQGVVLDCTGAAGLRRLSAERGVEVGRGEKGQALSLGLRLEGPQIYAPGLHIVPHVDGTVAIGSTSERDYADAKAVDDQLDRLLAKAIAVLPHLAGAPVLERWAGERPRAASRTLLLGYAGDRFVANGGFKTGFAMAPLAAGIMADLILDGQDRIPADWRLA